MQKKSSKILYDYWNELRGARSAPDRRNIDPTRIREALANTFILQTEEGAESFNFRLAGSHLCAAYCRELKSRSFSELWHERDRDAIATLIRAVTDDHAVALVTFTGTTAVGTQTKFETILLPLHHNGTTNTRILGGMTALDEPYWFGMQPIVEQRITGLRLIWPDDALNADEFRNLTAAVGNDVAWDNTPDSPSPVPAKVHGMSARRYNHLAVIDGGRDRN